jgi:hypothetical protein
VFCPKPARERAGLRPAGLVQAAEGEIATVVVIDSDGVPALPTFRVAAPADLTRGAVIAVKLNGGFIARQGPHALTAILVTEENAGAITRRRAPRRRDRAATGNAARNP